MKTTFNGLELGYEIFGQTGQPIVLIHGFGLDRSIWRDMASRYLANHRVILPDVRGHGESEAPKGIYSMTSLAKDIDHLLAFLGVSKAIVCGHSMGGYIALAFAENSPERLAGLGLITTRAKPDSEEARAGRYEMVEKVKEEGSIALAQSLAPKLSEDESIVSSLKDMIAQTPADGIIGALKGMAERPDRRDLLPKIKVPALVVAGEADQIIDLHDAEQMASALPRGEFLPIKDAGHMPMLETRSELGQGLLSLIHRVAEST